MSNQMAEIDRLCQLVAELEKERDELAAENEKLLARRGIKKYMALEQRRDELRAALREYGEHSPTCALEMDRVELGCTCGLNKALGEEAK